MLFIIDAMLNAIRLWDIGMSFDIEFDIIGS